MGHHHSPRRQPVWRSASWRKWRNLSLLATSELLAMTLWFSASAVAPQLTAEWHLSGNQQAWLTMSVQLGFVGGALLSAVLNLADRLDSRYLFAASACLGALANTAITQIEVGVMGVLGLRVLTGMAMAGVYPPGMKLMASWCKQDRGLGIGLLVGALTLGSAMPHLFNALPVFGEAGMLPWRTVMFAASSLAFVAAAIAACLIEPGPFLGPPAPFNWAFALQALRDPAARLANFGYLGHMWELYAMWAWVPMFLLASYEQAAWSLQGARLAGFGVIAVGAAGCVLAGLIADRVGRTAITIASLVVSGSCALVAGWLFASPGLLTALCLVWGFAVVADSAQFSAAVSELIDPRYVGTALTVQTSLGFLLTLLTIQVIPRSSNSWDGSGSSRSWRSAQPSASGACFDCAAYRQPSTWPRAIADQPTTAAPSPAALHVPLRPVAIGPTVPTRRAVDAPISPDIEGVYTDGVDASV